MSYHAVNQIEMRIIGCLIEKALTTPDQYPLSLNSLVNACNQKSNRDPVTHYTETDIQYAVDELSSRGLITEITGSHSRVSKYQHRFCNTEFSDLQFTPAETAIICLLFLRGPQTPGELRSRSGRLHDFRNLNEVEEALQALQEKTGGPYVMQLPREAGKRESRYQECFCSEHEVPSTAEHSETTTNPPHQEELKERIQELEETVNKLMERIQRLEESSKL